VAEQESIRPAHSLEGHGQSLTREEWNEISRRLREPFDPKDVDFRVQGRANEQTGKAQVVAYIDARAVQDRLDAVVGAGNWSFDWTPLVIDNGEVMVAKGTLTVYGVSKADAGSASNFEQSLGAVSHCFKRAAVHWGIGRYLYNLPMAWVPVERGRISEAVLNELRAKLPRPVGASAASGIEQGERVAETAVARPAPRQRPEPMIREPAAAAQPVQRPAPAAMPAASAPQSGEPAATEQQIASIRKLCAALGKSEPEEGLTFNQAKQVIVQLSGEYQRARKAS
jgi:Rad52/22 family double-strand break repair protein